MKIIRAVTGAKEQDAISILHLRQNHWLLEPDLKAILSKYWPDLPRHESSLIDFGAVAGGRAYEVAACFLSHLTKNRTAEHGAAATQLVMEIFGGLGLLDNFGIARLHRESLVTLIWEGTSNIQALDMLEAMRKKSVREAFLDEVLPMLKRANTQESYRALRRLLGAIADLNTLDMETAQWYSKDILRMFADVTQVALLYELAQQAGERYAKLAWLYERRFVEPEVLPYPDWALNDREVWWPL